MNSTVGIDELEFVAFTMHSIPTQSRMFTININADLNEVSVVNMLGRLFVVVTDLETKTITRSGLVNGACIVRITAEDDQQMVGTIQVR